MGMILSKDQTPDVPIKVPYHEACRHILWPAITTHPDIQYPTGHVAQFVKNPSKEHWHTVIQIIHYLYTIRDLWLVFGGEGDMGIGYADADWALQMDRHSIPGYTFHIRQGAFNWSLKWQSIIALSTTESKYIVGVHVVKEAEWLRQISEELRIKRKGLMVLCKNGKFHVQTKHMDICYHYIHKQVTNRKLKVLYIPSMSNPSDIMTKT
jgi:hypothetical protein